MAHVFLCYAKKDETEVKKLRSAISKAGLQVWMDLYNLDPGDPWKPKISTAIKKASAFIVCLSANFEKRPRVYSYKKVREASYKRTRPPLVNYRDEEIRKALAIRAKLSKEDRPRIIPVLLDATKVPEIFGELHVITVKSPAGKAKLVNGLLKLRKFPRKGSDPPVIANALLLSINYKERGRDQVIAWGAEHAKNRAWNWPCLGRALEYYLDAIQYFPQYQHSWTNIAYVYHLIGQSELARWCSKRSCELADAGPNYPGRNCKQVTEAMRRTTTIDGKRLVRKPMPDWFRRKFADFLVSTDEDGAGFRGVFYYTDDWPPRTAGGS